MLLSADEEILYVGLSNFDYVAAIDLERAEVFQYYRAIAPTAGTRIPGTVPLAIALSRDGHRLYAAFLVSTPLPSST